MHHVRLIYRNNTGDLSEHESDEDVGSSKRKTGLKTGGKRDVTSNDDEQPPAKVGSSKRKTGWKTGGKRDVTSSYDEQPPVKVAIVER